MSWIAPIMQTLISSLMLVGILKLLEMAWASRQTIKGVAIKAAKPMSEIIVRVLRDILIFWFLITMLRGLVTSEAQITRQDILLISFWMWWLMFYFAATLRLGINARKD